MCIRRAFLNYIHCIGIRLRMRLVIYRSFFYYVQFGIDLTFNSLPIKLIHCHIIYHILSCRQPHSHMNSFHKFLIYSLFMKSTSTYNLAGKVHIGNLIHHFTQPSLLCLTPIIYVCIVNFNILLYFQIPLVKCL